MKLWRPLAVAAKLGEKITRLRNLAKALEEEGRASQGTTAGWLGAPGYEVTADGESPGVWKLGEKKNTRITSAPINVSAVGYGDDGTYYNELRFLYGAEEHRRLIPRVVVAGPDILSLAGYGAPVSLGNRPALQAFLQAQEQANLSRIPRVQVMTRFGWNLAKRVFVLGKRIIGGSGVSVVEADERFLDALQPAGDLRATSPWFFL